MTEAIDRLTETNLSLIAQLAKAKRTLLDHFSEQALANPSLIGNLEGRQAAAKAYRVTKWMMEERKIN